MCVTWRRRSPRAKWSEILAGTIFIAVPPPPHTHAPGGGSWEDKCIMKKVRSGSQGCVSGGLEEEANWGWVSGSLLSPLP